jgi:hypothetical protein
MEQKQHPLIIVFYLDADMMRNPNIIGPFSDAINDMLFQKDANALAFFIPTTGEERVECLNPVVMSEADNEKVSQIIEDIKKNFSVGDGLDMDIDELTTKPCECRNNPGGSCQC